MRTFILVAAVVIALHTAAGPLVHPYGDLLVTVGGWFVHGTDVADLPEMVVAGWAAVGGVLLSAAVVLAYWAPALWRRHGNGS